MTKAREMAARDAPNWTIILPCAAPLDPSGRARPKWMLTTPDGRMLVRQAADSVPDHQVKRVIVAFLREAEELYGVTAALGRAFDREIECVVFDEPTSGPAETVYQTVKRAQVSGPLLIKDGDSFFTLPEGLPESSFLAVADLRNLPAVSEPGRKSYVLINEQGLIDDVVEKNVVSNFISVGLYGFTDALAYAKEYERLVDASGARRLFVSHVAANAMLDGGLFQPCYVENLVDIGTRADWNAYRARLPTIVTDIDGVIFKNQSLFFPPYWGEPVEPIDANIRHLLSLQSRGAQIIFMTSRPERFRAATEQALEAQGFQVHALVMDCQHGARYLVNDYAPSNPYPSAVAINVRRNTDDVQHILMEDHRTLEREP